jgi:hypothetical protein
MNATLYGRIVGPVLVLVGLAGFAMPTLMGMDLGPVHSVVHIVTGALLAYMGFAQGAARIAPAAVLVFGVVYLALGAVGFVVRDLVVYHAELKVNVIHLAVGLLGLVAARSGAPQAAAARAA